MSGSKGFFPRPIWANGSPVPRSPLDCSPVGQTFLSSHLSLSLLTSRSAIAVDLISVHASISTEESTDRLSRRAGPGDFFQRQRHSTLLTRATSSEGDERRRKANFLEEKRGFSSETERILPGNEKRDGGMIEVKSHFHWSIWTNGNAWPNLYDVKTFRFALSSCSLHRASPPSSLP